MICGKIRFVAGLPNLRDSSNLLGRTKKKKSRTRTGSSPSTSAARRLASSSHTAASAPTTAAAGGGGGGQRRVEEFEDYGAPNRLGRLMQGLGWRGHRWERACGYLWKLTENPTNPDAGRREALWFVIFLLELEWNKSLGNVTSDVLRNIGFNL